MPRNSAILRKQAFVGEDSYAGVAPAAVFLVAVDAVEWDLARMDRGFHLAGVSTPPARQNLYKREFVKLMLRLERNYVFYPRTRRSDPFPK